MRFVIHVSGVVTNDGKILLVRESKPISRGRWNLPGGHLKHGEPLVDGVVREIHEETGLTPTIEGLVGVYTRMAADDADHCIRFVFAAATDRTDAAPVLADEIQQCQWFTREQIDDLPDDQCVRKDQLRDIIADCHTNGPMPGKTLRDYR